ncbi:hypothetical protein B0H13DRAFT_705672 [Mycena leptocephala]|nr:hypothetical protein B0H13DRAFT_705672 [Mycena leptocephala]
MKPLISCRVSAIAPIVMCNLKSGAARPYGNLTIPVIHETHFFSSCFSGMGCSDSDAASRCPHSTSWTSHGMPVLLASDIHSSCVANAATEPPVMTLNTSVCETFSWARWYPVPAKI